MLSDWLQVELLVKFSSFKIRSLGSAEKANVWMNRHNEKQISMLETSTGTKQERIVASVERARFDFSCCAFVS
jgi:hypothetical protein